jgi:hypothetical protein
MICPCHDIAAGTDITLSYSSLILDVLTRSKTFEQVRLRPLCGRPTIWGYRAQALRSTPAPDMQGGPSRLIHKSLQSSKSGRRDTL